MEGAYAAPGLPQGVVTQISLQVEQGYLENATMKFRETESIADLKIGELEELFMDYKRMCVICNEIQKAASVVASGNGTRSLLQLYLYYFIVYTD